MRLLTTLIILSFFSCSGPKKTPSSYWETQKDNFKYQNKSEFVSDSLLRTDYKNLKWVSHSLFEKSTSDSVYLYSWQERDKSKYEFTVVKDDGELGLKIFYFILDKKDSLLSWTQIASKGGEGVYWFEKRSKFINKDTILNIGVITQWYDFNRKQKMEKPIGDSTFSFLVIDKSGYVTEKIFKEVKDLHFENE